jgi:anaerobic magnesium-protoporphyrin IX monomethyl ester cyclase
VSAPLDILLVNVGSSRKRIYQALSQDFSAVDPPFWAALTAGYLRGHGLGVDILDANVRNLDLAETAAEIVRTGARWTAIVVYSQQANVCTPIMPAVGALCREVKALDPGHQLVLTGWHPSALPQRTMDEEVCDALAVGEGFYTLRALLDGRPRADVPGLWWRDGAAVRGNPRPPNIQDLTAELGEVAWDLLPMASGHYRGFNWMCLGSLETRTHAASIMTSLGCPFGCTFCAIHATFGDRKIRYWSPAWALRQLDELHTRYGVRHINLNDELFVFDPDHYLPIAAGLIERGYGLNLCAFARVDRLDAMPPGELETLKRAGFNWFKLGIESANTAVLRQAHKGRYDREVIRRVVRKVHDAGIDLCANFMFGLPGDTHETMQETLDLALELEPAFPSFFCTMAIPGSDLYAEALAQGWELPATWLGYASQGYDFHPLPTATLTAADIVRFRDHAFDTYFGRPAYLDMIERKFGRAAREHVAAMTGIHLKRRLLGDPPP